MYQNEKNLFTVYNHVHDMVMKNTIPVVGVFFGEMKWSWEEVVTRKQAFMDMLVGATSRSEPVFLKVRTTSKDKGKTSKINRTKSVK